MECPTADLYLPVKELIFWRCSARTLLSVWNIGQCTVGLHPFAVANIVFFEQISSLEYGVSCGSSGSGNDGKWGSHIDGHTSALALQSR